MKLLAIDTSTEYLSLAVTDGGRVLSSFHEKAAMKHSSLLVPMIDRVLKKAKLTPHGIDGICVSAGPGSFTGLRIGITTVKGFAYALKKRIVAVPTLDVIAYNAEGFKGFLCPVLDARKGKVYACIYRSDGKSIKRLSKYLLLPAKELMEKMRGKNALFMGDAIDQVEIKKDYLKDWYPRAEVVAALGSQYFRKKKYVKPEELEPMYLYSRECDITGK
ncbi:MAG: tRNA (adenosine(37)-N6)-threonylcarbamoyltransferase complex dimerization subunit type 1 TsaB [Candidatus Omnitrophota bacterium]|nr:tRNA (adenosine(37)-N6)-threonylcarbamoyltransferase complex dimerization subunit type 1 TsaB [Candidatus Omnitrophota bacterium]